jgi:hypothetical protein
MILTASQPALDTDEPGARGKHSPADQILETSEARPKAISCPAFYRMLRIRRHDRRGVCRLGIVVGMR